MHIAHVITRGDVGGAQTHVVELASAQVTIGHDVTVIAGSGGPALARCEALGARPVIVPRLGGARQRPWQRGVLRDLRVAVERVRPDIVHAHSSNAGLLARVVCWRRYPCVYTAHGWPFQRGAARGQRIMSFAGEFVAGHLGDGVVCLTDAEADRARRARVVRRGRLWVIPNGIHDVQPELVRQPRVGSVSVVMVARFAPPKLQHAVVDAMATIRDLPWRMTFVGDGPELDECRRQASSLLGDRIDLLGHRDDVPEILAEHDIAVLWSRYEGMPMSLLEAMRAGLCCVASDLPGVRALFGNPPCGLVAGTTEELADIMRELMNDPAAVAAFGQRSRARFLEAFTAEAMTFATHQVYGEVVAGFRKR